MDPIIIYVDTPAGMVRSYFPNSLTMYKCRIVSGYVSSRSLPQDLRARGMIGMSP